jgi:hypothetical protein
VAPLIRPFYSARERRELARLAEIAERGSVSFRVFELARDRILEDGSSAEGALALVRLELRRREPPRSVGPPLQTVYDRLV